MIIEILICINETPFVILNSIGQLMHTGYSATVNISHRGGEIPLEGISKLEMKMCGPTGTLSKKKKS